MDKIGLRAVSVRLAGGGVPPGEGRQEDATLEIELFVTGEPASISRLCSVLTNEDVFGPGLIAQLARELANSYSVGSGLSVVESASHAKVRAGRICVEVDVGGTRYFGTIAPAEAECRPSPFGPDVQIKSISEEEYAAACR